MSKIRAVNNHDDLHSLADLLLLVGVKVDASDVAEWTVHQQNLASDWAAKTHLRASDNPVRVPPMPEFLKRFEE